MDSWLKAKDGLSWTLPMVPMVRFCGVLLPYRCGLAVKQPFVVTSRRGFVVLPASSFKHIWEADTQAEAIYKGSPLMRLSNKVRGDAIGIYTCQVLKEEFPAATIEKPERGVDRHGNIRARGKKPYDLLMDGKRVEVKSSLLHWHESQGLWGISFQNVKLGDSFDRLLVWLLTPAKLLLYEHDMLLGVASSGQGTEVDGHQVQLLGSRGTEDWTAAVKQLRAKLDASSNGCRLLATRPVAELMSTFQEPASSRIEADAYGELPLFHAANRGARLETLAWEVAQLLNFLAGHQMGRYRYGHQCDWFEGDCRVECKSAKLSWNSYASHQRWEVQFTNVKFDKFDMLQLVLYTPRAVFIYAYRGSAGISSNGVATRISGHRIYFVGPQHEKRWDVALDAICQKVEGKGSELTAVVDWSL